VTQYGIRRLAITFAVVTACSAAPAVAGDERAELHEEGDRAQALVVRLTTPSTEGAGIVFHVDENHAYGITAKHVVYQYGKVVEGITAELRAWPGRKLAVDVPKFHYEEDLAVFRADLRPLERSRQELLRGIPLDQLGSSTGLDPGSELSCVGHAPSGAWLTPKETIRFARPAGKHGFLFEFSCPQGHSGGGVFDGEWRLVGMMIDEDRPYCRALRIEPILKIVQGWKLDIDLSSPPSRSADPALARQLTVAVVGFDNRSGKDLPDLGSVAQDITTSFLHVLPGVVLVTRDRMKSVRQEIDLPGSVDTAAGVSRVGRLLNADALITGSVIRYDVERRTFEGFGTSALQDIFRMGISLQILDVGSGQVRFSQTFDVERTKQYPKKTSAPGRPIDMTSELLTALLEQAQPTIKSALAQVAAGLGTAHQFIAVPVTTTPAGADVIVKGIYMGSTPLTLQLTMDTHEIAIELAGHESWRRRVNVQPGTTIEVNLLRKNR
jgi:hypothetical protein